MIPKYCFKIKKGYLDINQTSFKYVVLFVDLRVLRDLPSNKNTVTKFTTESQWTQGNLQELNQYKKTKE